MSKFVNIAVTWINYLDRWVSRGKCQANHYYATFSFYFSMLVGMLVKHEPIGTLSDAMRASYPTAIGEVALTLVLFFVATALTFPAWSVLPRLCVLAVLFVAAMLIGLLLPWVSAAVLAVVVVCYAIVAIKIAKRAKRRL